MKKTLISSVIAVVVFTLLLGVAYPLAMTGVSQVLFPTQANGSQIERDGTVVGSTLLGQDFSRPTGQKDSKGKPITEPIPRYFQPRPSQTGYNPAGTLFSNRGPNQESARDFYRQALASYLRLEGRYDPGLTKAGVPVDAVTTSASGVDPHISPENARIQAHRIAAVRHLPAARVLRLIEQHTDGRFLGLAGEPGVNVTELNLALDAEAR